MLTIQKHMETVSLCYILDLDHDLGSGFLLATLKVPTTRKGLIDIKSLNLKDPRLTPLGDLS
jgi:hypothetical protein